MRKQEDTNYEVIIVGAGPSGLAAALTLLEEGISDLIVIERFEFPRYKCCAGYITGKTKAVYETFGLNIEEAHYSLIRDFNIFYRLKKRQTILNKFLYTNRMIDRVELDNTFAELAKSKGIQIKENTTISEHDADKKELKLSNGEILTYEKLIFADGTSGFGSRLLPARKKNIAMQLVFPNSAAEEIQIHFGITKHGYGWVSSYGGFTNVGLTDVFDKSVNYHEVFAGFLKQLGLQADMSELRGAFTPMKVGEGKACEDIYFVGDAVGACDPMTLSGLRYGLDSGRLCAEAIAKKDDRLYFACIRKMKKKFALMRTLQKIFYLKVCQVCVFDIGCRCFHRAIAYVFNHFFVNKK